MTNQVTSPETVAVNINAEFMDYLIRWHEAKVATLKHLLDIPEGTLVNHNEGQPVILTGEALECFKIGVEVCLMELGELPFTEVIESTSN